VDAKERLPPEESKKPALNISTQTGVNNPPVSVEGGDRLWYTQIGEKNIEIR
jgi:hypothetical protein